MKNITSIAFLLLFGFFLNAANATSIQGPILDESTFEKYEIINPVRIAGGGVKDNRGETLIVYTGGITQPSIPSSIKDYKMLLNAASTNPKVTPVILEQSKLIAVGDTCAYLVLQTFNAIIDSALSLVTDGNYQYIQDKVFNEFMVDYKKEGTNGESPFTESEITLMATTITTAVKKLKPLFIYDPRSSNAVVKPTLSQIINVTNNTLGFTTPPPPLLTATPHIISLSFDDISSKYINYGQTTYIWPSDICVLTNMNSSSQTNLTQLPGYSGSPVMPW